jgi:SAM-dependent methyltransferase
MNTLVPDMSTDSAWEEWGRKDAYFGVITNPKFRSSELTEESKREFFDSGRWHVDYVMQIIRKHVDADFAPKQILDFGCGVGRVLIPFAALAQQVYGIDVSTSMLLEAKRNCQEHGVLNAHFLESDDNLSSLTSGFDLIHSCIVFQHIPVERGRAILGKLLQRLNPGGVGAIQLTYSKAHFAATHGIAPPESQSDYLPKNFSAPNADPAIQMNPYNMNSTLFTLQQCGVSQFYADFTDHGGELGVFLFFRKSIPSSTV